MCPWPQLTEDEAQALGYLALLARQDPDLGDPLALAAMRGYMGGAASSGLPARRQGPAPAVCLDFSAWQGTVNLSRHHQC